MTTKIEGTITPKGAELGSPAMTSSKPKEPPPWTLTDKTSFRPKTDDDEKGAKK